MNAEKRVGRVVVNRSQQIAPFSETRPMSLILGINDQVLRKQLAEITKPADAAELKAQVQQMANLALTHPHTVSIHKENIPGSPLFNCYQYSFGIADVHLRDDRGFLPGRDFAQYLVEHHLQEVGPEDAENGDHIFYSSSQIQHAGRVQGAAIESKWGTGHVWRHAVYEVPVYYGDTVRFYRLFSRESVLQVLHQLGFQTSSLP